MITNDTLIFLDWDDTLIPTTWLGENDYLESNEDDSIYIGTKDTTPYSLEYKEYIKSLKDFLIELQKYGHIIILTASSEKWIDISMFFLGIETEEILKSISRSHTKNKMDTMADLTFEYSLYTDLKTIVSIGDGIQEKEAIKSRMLHLPQFQHRCIKLAESPSLETLTNELNILKNSIQHIISGKGAMFLEFRNEL